MAGPANLVTRHDSSVNVNLSPQSLLEPNLTVPFSNMSGGEVIYAPLYSIQTQHFNSNRTPSRLSSFISSFSNSFKKVLNQLHTFTNSLSLEGKDTIILGGVTIIGGIFYFPSLIVSAPLFLSGCGLYYEGRDTQGKTGQCDGKSAKGPDPVIEFKVNLTEAEKNEIIQKLKETELKLREYNPEIFCKFNGYKLVEQLSSTSENASYDAYYKEIKVRKTLMSVRHELGHYISDWHGINHEGTTASETEKWKQLSCIVNNTNYRNTEEVNKNCVIGTLGAAIKQSYSEGSYLEEEFAETTGYVINSLTDFERKYAEKPGALKQGQYILEILKGR